MSTIPACPSCTKENTYQDGDLYICADCFHEWSVNGSAIGELGEMGVGIVRDVNDNPLADGDSVILIKDLKVKVPRRYLKKEPRLKVYGLVMRQMAMRLIAEWRWVISCSRQNF